MCLVKNSKDTAIAEMSVSHMPTLRKRKYALLAGAIKDLPVDSIVRSWDATGIPRALWGDVPSIKPMFDVLKKLRCEETQHPCDCGSLTARKCLSCSEYVCDGFWLDHTTTICPVV